MPFIIRKATPQDAEALQLLYFHHLINTPPKEPEDIALWCEKLSRFEQDPNYFLLVGEEDGKVVSSVTLVIIENLTHGMHPYAVMENVVTHREYRGKHYASDLIRHGKEIATARGCYKIMLMTGSKQESTLRFYRNCGFDQTAKTAFLMRL